MANIVMILGKSGSGKSTSIKGLDPKNTVIINVLNKRLPFKGSMSIYNNENKNLFRIDTYEKTIDFLNNCDKSEKVKNIVLDDCIYVMRKEFFTKATEVGYTKFSVLAQHFQQIISTCEKLRDSLNVFILLHSEDVQSDRTTVGYKVATVGQMIDNQYNLLEVVPMVLYSIVKFNEKGKATYGFYTHTVLDGSVQIPAKSPEGMFEEDFIPNDLKIVEQAMEEYYK